MGLVEESKGIRLGLAAVVVVALAACGKEPPASPVPVPAPADTVAAPEEPEERPAGEPIPDEVVADTAVEPEPEPEPPVKEEPAEPEVRRPARPPVPVLPGAVLPRARIVAFYGNPASRRMGILGEVPPNEMLSRLDAELAAWRRADPGTPVKPALHMIAVMAAGDPGPDSLYRIRMPDRRIEDVMEWADRRDALVFLDIQPGRSTVRRELPHLLEWLRRPDVHLALDPEWSMGPGHVPGRRIGSMSADDINYAIDQLAALVEEHDLPPKVLVVHRFTSNMVRNAGAIRTDPRVQVVMNMDGWGPPSQKRHAYREIVAPEASQFTGFKLFFKNDLKGGSRLMTPEEILQLDPAPIYIQYQ
jgi:hypothetical protein